MTDDTTKKIIEDLLQDERHQQVLTNISEEIRQIPVMILYHLENEMPPYVYNAIGFLRKFKTNHKNVVLDNNINIQPPHFCSSNNYHIEIPAKNILSYSVLIAKKK